MADNFNLGRPIGGVEGEHGAGTGLSGGYGQATAANTQSGKYAEQERSGFNAGLGGDHASGGIPHGHSGSGSSHPIADQFSSGNYSQGQGNQGSVLGNVPGEKLDNSLDNYSGEARSGSHSHSHSHGGALGAGAAGLGAGALGAGAASSYGGQEAVSGEYAGQGTSDALTGESHATRTGAGVGPLGENTSAGGLSGAGTTDSSSYGTGVGASGGAGGHYDESSRSGAGAGLAAGAGAGALGAGAASHGRGESNNTGSTDPNAKTGHFGTAEKDFERGAPVSDPKSLDSGGPHSLVYQESTGKYVHRHELEGAGSATRH